MIRTAFSKSEYAIKVIDLDLANLLFIRGLSDLSQSDRQSLNTNLESLEAQKIFLQAKKDILMAFPPQS